MTAEQCIRELYGFAFPDEFFRFRDFLTRLPANLLGDVCDMWPAFPFDAADGRPPKDYPEHTLWEDRYYHDLPEFITLFNGTTDGLHYGYFFDSPGELPPVVAHYWHSDTFQHAIDGDTLFEAVRWHLENAEVEFKEMAEDPEEAEYCRERLEQTVELRNALSAFWGADRRQTAEDYLGKYRVRTRRKPVAATWDGLGIVVRRGLYRKLSADLIAGHRIELEPAATERLVAEATAQLGRGHPGAALKLGRDLWVWGREFPQCYNLLDAAYAALGREVLRGLLGEVRRWREHCEGVR